MGLVWIASLAEVAASAPPAPRPSLQDIVVTGERVRRTLSQTSSSVVVLRGDDIEQMADADRIDDLLVMVPNVQAGGGGEGPAIRGQDSTGVLRDLPAFLGGTRPRVTLQVDGRAVGFNEFVFGANGAWDVDQVEVFRSPQTTTQGRNSIAGAIFVTTRNPGYDFEGRVRGLAGNGGSRQASFVLSGPILMDQIAVRASGDLRRERTASRISGSIIGADPNQDRHSTARIKMLVEPRAIPGLRLNVVYAHAYSIAPQTEIVARPFELRRDPAAGYGVFRIAVDSVTATADLALGTRFFNRTTFSKGDARIRRFAPRGLGQARVKSSDHSVENVTRWQSPGGAELIGGVHYLRATQDQKIDLSAVLGIGSFDDDQESLGLFLDSAFTLLPNLKLRAGLRYQQDRQRRAGQIGPASLDYDGRFSAWLPRMSLTYQAKEDLSFGLVVQRAHNPGGTTINLENGGPETFAPEKLWNYEVFGRARWRGASLAINLFRSEIDNAQRANPRQLVVPGAGTATWAEIYNIERARTWGAEAELDWKIAANLHFRVGAGYLQTRILRGGANPIPTLGREFQRSPDFSFAGSAEWRPWSPLSLSAQVRHHGAYFSDDANSPLLRIAPATLIDARAAYSWGRYVLAAYVRNAADAFRLRYMLSLNRAIVEDPREYGVSLEARF